MAQSWHSMSPEEVVTRLRTNEQNGITPEDAQRRLNIHGRNQLSEKKARSKLAMFLGQFDDFMVLVLLGATAISALMGEMADAITIITIVVLNSVLGFIQENRAEDSLVSLRRLAAPRAQVIRAGSLTSVPGDEIVPGDLLVLTQGDRVPADCRLISSAGLEIDESPLTGESFPVRKRHRGVLAQGCALGDRTNMAYAGTVVTKGTGRAIIVETGMNTEVGGIARSISEVEDEDTPLQKRLDRLGQALVVVCLAVCAVVAFAGVMRGEPIYRMVLVGVSLAVAAIPEGLPAVVTISLALGVQRMIAKNAIVRRLPAVETLGCSTVICSDKTGTITANQMTVRAIATAGGLYDVTGSGYDPKGEISRDGRPLVSGPDIIAMLTCAGLCNNAEYAPPWKKRPRGLVEGDPTEVALLVACHKAGITAERLRIYSRAYEVPFESERRRMSVVVTGDAGPPTAFVKGAPDVILGSSTRILHNGVERPITPLDRKRFAELTSDLASRALRVLAMARRTVESGLDEPDASEIERDLTLLGLVGMIDPPRPEVVLAVATCHTAGLKTIMITGDHLKTAEAVAREVGIMRKGQASLSGRDLDQMDDRELERSIGEVSVFARVTPAHKLRIVRALKKRGHIVAMTGDGVNDAPAVKEADIGVSMGISGTDVTREASAMVLADDNFATIVAAIEEGRSIYDNIRKFIRYLLSCNVGEVLIMFLAGILGYPVPLLPIQMLWVNLVTDGLPAVALSVDPPSANLMSEPPRKPNESVFSHGLAGRIVRRGCYIGLLSFGTFVAAFESGNTAYAQTVALCTLILFQMFHVFDCRTERANIFDIGFGGNRALVLAVLSSLGLTMLVLYVPGLRNYFHTVPLGLRDWATIILVSGSLTLLQGIRHIFRPR